MSTTPTTPTPPSPRKLPRRRFLAAASKAAACGAGALAVPWIAPARALGLGGALAPGERLGIGIIGVGGRGTNHLDAFLARGDSQVVAICDPYQGKRDAAKRRAEEQYSRAAGSTYVGCLSTSDFREVLARGDVDAVAIASPENWHALQSAHAARAGKDVYCEKALSITVAEGRAVVEAVRRHGRIFQFGTQQRSDRSFRHACELARNGCLGKVHTVIVSVPGGRVLPVAPPTPVPPGLDYEMWLGPAPWTPHNDLKGTHNWYYIRDYCMGWIESWGIHHIDIALWGSPGLARGVLEVEGTAVFPAQGLANTSVTWDVTLRTSDGVRVLFSDEGKRPHGVRFQGDAGWVHVVRGGIWAEPQSLLGLKLKPGDERLHESHDHHDDFVRSVRSRRDPAAPVEGAHTGTAVTLVSDIATRLGRKLRWDWSAERFLGDDEANRLLRRPMHSPWIL